MTKTAFTPAVTFTADEIEATRLDRLAAVAASHDKTAEQLAADFAPGTVGCHEAMHLASVFMDTVDRPLCDHPAVLSNPDWYRLADEAQTALFNLYQAMGAKTAGVE
jgi:hypothetical protein